ncbi:transglycosylase SLT domain-containing protein [Campylobacter sp. RM13119]|uniref:lytic transglycosylase domain-containing protein n=1 Tax=Campylobacter TaxID=194 RepID=UPI0014744039|nr:MULTISPECIES: lytic transglycosylase domain-containing protein [unclassified Campylobacter]MBE3021515.1 transglycosylase SLT domain-containing protein [Campylobacter sp. 7477a]MBE3605738.1 transglycosylase SLT domain-containing protein [Campylobacter sp. RM13119]MBE3609795.1 transglycosylase SLT domain-containing protein [Campylobacter sp. RM12916]
MKAMLKIFMIFACAISLFANTSDRDFYEAQVKILKELDINPSFIKTSYYTNMKKSIKNSHIKTFTDALKNGYVYIPMIKEHIQNSKVPDSFFYLAMIESGFSNHTVSKAKAAGMWQFMPKTAKMHGLNINEYVDERRDPFASTKAATTYLSTLKKQFGKWYLAAMAYNCGDGCLSKAIKAAGTDDLATLIDPQKKYLPPETRQFVIKILRAAYIARETNFLLSKDSSLLNPKGGLKLVQVTVPGGTNLMHVGDGIGLSLKKMKTNNPHLKYVFTEPNLKNTYVYIPENKKEIFSQNFKPLTGKKDFFAYTVKRGDTLLAIAKKTGVSHKAIKDFNELKTNAISQNQKLIIPRSKDNSIQNYTVQNGETLAEISKKFNVKEKDIRDANSLASSNLNAGESIVIP